MKVKKNNTLAVIISYLTTVLTALSSIIIVPVCLKNVGSDQYGLYQKIYAVAQYLMIIDLGICSTVIRYATEAKVQGDKEKELSIYGFMCKVTFIINVIVLLFGVILFFTIDKIYNKMETAETIQARTLLSIMIVTSFGTIFLDFLNGIINTQDLFIFSNTFKFIRIFLRVVLIPVFILITKSVTSMAIVDLCLTYLNVLMALIFILFKLKIKASFSKIDKKIVSGAIALMLVCLLQNISKFLNNGIDKILLGRILGNEAVTVYSIAMTFISFFILLSTVIQSVNLPTIVSMNTNGASIEELTDEVVKIGRIQLILCGGFLCGFALLGQEFIKIWTSVIEAEDVKNAYYTSLIIMVPLLIPLIQNICLSILTAKDKRLFRALVVVGLSILNLVSSIFLIKIYGILGAAIGTAIAYVVGNIIVMNIYYKVKIKIPVLAMFYRILSRIIFCLIFVGVALYFIFKLMPVGTLFWIIKALIFILAYSISLLLFGLNKTEKKLLSKTIKKLLRVKNDK